MSQIPSSETAQDPLAPQSSESDSVARDTYRYLRVAPLIVAAFLGVALFLQFRATGCHEESISAYYYTPVHSVFIATLCVIGICLIVNQGNSPFEDVVLNFSGFLAFIVAMVPTFENAPKACKGPSIVYDTHEAISNNVAAVLLAALLAEIIRWWVIRGRRDAGYLTVPVIGVALLEYAIVAVIVWRFLTDGAWFIRNAHNWAAITMFAGIIVVILTNAAGAALNRDRAWAWGYMTTAAVMVGGIILAARLKLGADGSDYRVFWVEVVVISAFAIFWLAQTLELWDYKDREDKSRRTGTSTTTPSIANQVSGA